MVETQRLILRPFQIGDEDDMLEYLSTITQHCFLGMKADDPRQMPELLAQRVGQPLYLAIVKKDTGKVIGEVFAEPEGSDPEGAVRDTFSPCWLLNPRFQGQGYGYEAAHAFIDYLFTCEGARRVYMFTEDDNLACQRLCKKLGARQEGLFMEFVSFIDDENGNPIYENTYQYAILKKEWKNIGI